MLSSYFLLIFFSLFCALRAQKPKVYSNNFGNFNSDDFGPSAGQLLMFFGIPALAFVILVIVSWLFDWNKLTVQWKILWFHSQEILFLSQIILAMRHWYWTKYGFGPGVQRTIITQTNMPGMMNDPFNNRMGHHHRGYTNMFWYSSQELSCSIDFF